MVGWQKDYLETFEHLTPFFGFSSPDSQQSVSPEALPRKKPSTELATLPMWKVVMCGSACS